MVKIVAFMGMVIIGLFILGLQFTAQCNFQLDLGMQDLNNRKAAYMEAAQAMQQKILDSFTQPAEPSPDDPNAF